MEFHHILILALTLLRILTPTKSAKILGIFPIYSKSHHSFNQPVVKGLAAKGHEVTVISYFQLKNAIPNYSEVLLRGHDEELQDWVDSVPIQAATDNFTGIPNYIKNIFAIEKPLCEKVFALEYIKKLIKTEEKRIDLIMAEVYNMQCYHLLAHKLNVPLILFAPPPAIIGVEYFVGNPFNPSVRPLVMSSFNPKTNFWQRLLNSLYYAGFYWYRCNKFNEGIEEYARRVFDMELPSDEELNRRTALAFYNNHFSFNPRARSPALIDIGGVHIEEPKPLPKDIEEFIEGSPQGVIFFSFGSQIKASSIPVEKLKIIVDAFSSIPQRVLWRVDELNITKVPPNVKLATWFPQRDILEHKNVIVFISQCGLMGTFEAIQTATPMIAVPLEWDQFHNANTLVEKNVAVYVDYTTMDKNVFLAAINEIIINTKFRENMQTLSKTFKDRPMSPLNEALYWSEYALKHQGAPHLRTAGADMPLYQYLLLDVIVFLLGIVLSFLYLLRYTFKIIISLVFQTKKKRN